MASSADGESLNHYEWCGWLWCENEMSAFDWQYGEVECPHCGETFVVEDAKTAELRERVEAVVQTPVDTETLSHFESHAGQQWYRNRSDVMDAVKGSGSYVVSAGSCDMVDLLGVCEEQGWSMREEAAEVFVVEDSDG